MPNIDTGLYINTPTAADRTTATAARNGLTSLLVHKGDGSVQDGRMAGSGSLLVQSASTSTLLFSVTPGYAVVKRAAAPTLGAYIIGSAAAVPLTLTAANASNPRIDAVYICQPDPEAGDSTHARIDVVVGTPAATPTAPLDSALPQGSLRLANILVPAGATAASACTITTIGAFEAGLQTNLPVYAAASGLPSGVAFGSKAIVQNPGSSIPSNTTFIFYGGTSGPFGNGWNVWDVPGSNVPLMGYQGDISLDSSVGQNSVVIKGGNVLVNFAIYSSNQRSNGQYWGAMPAFMRPIGNIHCQSNYFDSTSGLCVVLFQPDGGMVQSFSNQGVNRPVNGVRGTAMWPITF